MSFSDIAKYGKYYNPANLHYNTTTRVMCDRCKRNNLIACIGYLDQDLCLPCAEQVTAIDKRNEFRPEILTLMRTTRFDDEPLSRMVTDRFIQSRNENLTYMMTGRFDADDDSVESIDVPRPVNTRPRVLTKMMTKRFSAPKK